ncbi:hypothetical protein BJ165DRAFT_1460991 [Panaeolus papilionaceus]|nr:hypothetical protein BJ165DRAFT_1460991 [Panaeolus papilionaceus]
MKFFITPFAAAALLATETLAQNNGFTINSLMNVVVCQPSRISWVGGTPPYFLSILPANQPAAQPIEDLGTQNGNSITWIADLGVGTSAFLNLKDSTGLTAQSGTFTILTGTDTSCLGKNPNTSATSGGASSGASGGTPAPNTSGTAGTSATKSGSGTPTGSPSPTQSKGAASALSFNVAIPAILGAAAIAMA